MLCGLLALAAAASISASPDARAQTVPEVETPPDAAIDEDAACQAALQNAIAEALAAQELRERQAEYERLKARNAELDAEIASLEAQIEAEKARRKSLPPRFGLGAGFVMAAVAVAMAVLASRRWGRESGS
jgi:multidrug efflux pump subunit AcrA (membrane-fusion protein)